MKNIYLSLLLLFSAVILHAQAPFSSIGAAWHYGIYNQIFQATFPVTLQCTDTSTINGKLCSKITLTTGFYCDNNITDRYLYTENDTVFYYIPYNNNFGVLYCYNAQPGDSVIITGGGINDISQFTMMVDSTALTSVNGQLRRVIYWHPSDTWSGAFPYEFSGDVIEGIVDSNFLFPQIAVCDPQAIGLRCYSDSIVGLYNTGIVANCNDTLWLGINDLNLIHEKDIFPNPVDDVLHLNLQTKDAPFKIYDVTGNTVMKGILTTENAIPVQLLRSGVYFIHITNAQTTIVRKFLKR